MSYTDYLKELLRPLGVYDVEAPFNGGELTAAGEALDGALGALDFAGIFVARAGCRGADRPDMLPRRGRDGARRAGTWRRRPDARGLCRAPGCAVRWRERCGGVRRVVSGACR